MDAAEAARRWGDTWRRGWPARDLEAVCTLYHPAVIYSSEPFREPLRGMADLRGYFSEVFDEESEISAWFGDPVVHGQRASIEWWATLLEDGAEMSLVGTSTLRFDATGLVVEQRDTWNQSDGHILPREGWGR